MATRATILKFTYWSYVGGGKGCSIICWGTMDASQKVAGSIPDEVIVIFNCLNPSSRTMALGPTQPLKGCWPEHKADSLTAICELIIYKM
jgi:hypothetical protein